MVPSRDEWQEIWKQQEARKAATKHEIPVLTEAVYIGASGMDFNGTQHAPPIAKPSKYRNKPTNGYASIKESKRAAELKMLEQRGAIKDLREQVSYLLIPKQDGERACHYRADFVYMDACGHLTVEDVKGMRTSVYNLKRKLMLFVHGIRIVEV